MMMRRKHVEELLNRMYWEATRDCLVMMAGYANRKGCLTREDLLEVLHDKERIRDAEMRGAKR